MSAENFDPLGVTNARKLAAIQEAITAAIEDYGPPGVNLPKAARVLSRLIEVEESILSGFEMKYAPEPTTAQRQ